MTSESKGTGRNGRRASGQRRELTWSTLKTRLQVLADLTSHAEAEHEPAPDALLRRRAALLAQPRTAQTVPTATSLLLEFYCARQHYAIAHHWVRRVRELPPVTPLPGMPAHVLGIVCLGGVIHAVNDLAQLLGLTQATDEPTRASSAAVIVIANDEMEMAFKVDDVIGVTALDGQQESANPNDARRYVIGLRTDGVAVIDGERLLNDERLIVETQP